MKEVIWITGASSGIGRSLTKEFAKNGFKVFATARRILELKKFKDELAIENLDIEILNCDVTSYKSVEKTFNKILSKENKINCLINNAGITSFKYAYENSIDEIEEVINTNLLGSIFTIKSVISKMINQKSGTIINIISVASNKIFLKSSIYSASKSGLLAYSKVLREEVRKYNIKIIDIIPGATDTSIWSSEFRELNSNKMMKSNDVAKVVVWSFLQKNNLVTEEIVIRPLTGDF